MTLVEAIDGFLQDPVVSDRPLASESISLELLRDYFAESPTEHYPASLIRDLLSRWYVEASASRDLPSPQILLKSIADLLESLDRKFDTHFYSECSPVLQELGESLPRAIEITRALAKHLAARGGAISFPEFLTTFADGGQSSYDIDVAGEGKGPGALEGYFRVNRVEGRSIELEELISEENAWPVIFPEEVSRLIEPGYIMNLEIIRLREGWEIAACGFAYPPGTEI